MKLLLLQRQFVFQVTMRLTSCFARNARTNLGGPEAGTRPRMCACCCGPFLHALRGSSAKPCCTGRGCVVMMRMAASADRTSTQPEFMVCIGQAFANAIQANYAPCVERPKFLGSFCRNFGPSPPVFGRWHTRQLQLLG
jgi:hypothetical protein